jgi:hypothetical protein
MFIPNKTLVFHIKSIKINAKFGSNPASLNFRKKNYNPNAKSGCSFSQRSSKRFGKLILGDQTNKSKEQIFNLSFNKA